MAMSTRLLLFQPRTRSGSALAFTTAEVRAGASLRTFAEAVFRDHLTATSIEIYDQDTLLDTIERTTILDGVCSGAIVDPDAPVV